MHTSMEKIALRLCNMAISSVFVKPLLICVNFCRSPIKTILFLETDIISKRENKFRHLHASHDIMINTEFVYKRVGIDSNPHNVTNLSDTRDSLTI